MSDPASLITRKTGDWWKDDRRNWCAYCGCKIERQNALVTARATRDHVIPRAHDGRHVTIPCCHKCNRSKGNSGLPEFMLTKYFSEIRSKRAEKSWPLKDLWLVMALAAVEQARHHAVVWPVGKSQTGKNLK